VTNLHVDIVNSETNNIGAAKGHLRNEFISLFVDKSIKKVSPGKKK
jgi:hypothetical protein